MEQYTSDFCNEWKKKNIYEAVKEQAKEYFTEEQLKAFELAIQ